MKNNTIDAKLLNAEIAIENAISNKVIQEAMAVYGYNKARLLAAKSMLEDVKLKHTNQKKEYGEQYDATDALYKAMADANKVYMKHVKIARVILKSRGVWESLQIAGRRKHTYSGWVQQATVFYTNAMASNEIKKELSTVGIDNTVLTNMLAKVHAVGKRLSVQLNEKGEAQDATAKRDEALEELLEWMADFTALARVALEEEAQLLEMLGIIQPAD